MKCYYIMIDRGPQEWHMLSEGGGGGCARAKTNLPYFKPPCPCFNLMVS